MSKEKANVKLRGLFASMMWLPIVESDKLPRNTVVECIKTNVSKDFLTVNLCASKVDDTHLSLLARCMHKNLTRVDLNFWMCPRLTGKGVEDLARQMPSKLKTLKLNFKLLGQRLIETPCACTQVTVIMHCTTSAKTRDCFLVSQVAMMALLPDPGICKHVMP